MSESYRTIAILPWLNLKSPIELLGVSFTPYLNEFGAVSESIVPIEDKLNSVFKSLLVLGGGRRKNCVVVFLRKKEGLDWKLSKDDLRTVRQAVPFLYLTSLASNEYFQQLRSYTNSSYFRYFFQNVPTGKSDRVSFEIKRRGGGILVGGVKASESMMVAPLQCYEEGPEKIDADLVTAINSVHEKHKDIFERLFSSLGYFSMSHTDDDFIESFAEVPFMAAAFEALLATDKAWRLSKELGQLLAGFGSVKAKDVLKLRNGIVFDRDFEGEQKEWFAHSFWIKELHNLRSALIHAESIDGRSWGWTPGEHLVIGTFIYPLVIKLMLEKCGAYSLTFEDKGYCFAIDKILEVKKWGKEVGGNTTVWSKKIFDAMIQASVAKHRKLMN